MYLRDLFAVQEILSMYFADYLLLKMILTAFEFKTIACGR